MRFHEITKSKKYPLTINGWELAHEAQKWHHTPQDFEDGDIYHNITAFDTYHLKELDIKGLRLDLFSIDDELVNDYAALTSAAPPIIYDPIHNIIIDGNHRANAANQRGDSKILAYVGDPSTYDPQDYETDDMDEWQPDEDY